MQSKKKIPIKGSHQPSDQLVWWEFFKNYKIIFKNDTQEFPDMNRFIRENKWNESLQNRSSIDALSSRMDVLILQLVDLSPDLPQFFFVLFIYTPYLNWLFWFLE